MGASQPVPSRLVRRIWHADTGFTVDREHEADPPHALWRKGGDGTWVIEPESLGLTSGEWDAALSDITIPSSRPVGLSVSGHLCSSWPVAKESRCPGGTVRLGH